MLRSTQSVFFALLVILAAVGQTFRGLRLTRTVPLAADTFHVQGLEAGPAQYWVTSVDTSGHRGLLMLFDANNGQLIRSADVQDGIRYHAGGLSADGGSLWIPVAEYRKQSTSVIQKREKNTLQLQYSFPVKDHIGAIAVVPEGIVGANWDARTFYLWDRNGKELRVVPNPSSVAIQDMKFDAGHLIGGGTRTEKAGVVIWFEWPSLKVIREMNVDKTDRGYPYTREGFAIRGEKVWFLPEDNNSRVFLFELVP